MGRIVYTITSGELPITVNLKQDGVIIYTNTHSSYGTYSFENVDKGTEDYVTFVIDFYELSTELCGTETITLCVNCPDGWQMSGDKCIYYDEVEPTYTTPTYTIVAKNDDDAYSIYGAIVFDGGWDYNGTGDYERILPLTNTYWANTPYPSFTGVMNRTAVWASSTKTNQDIAFTFCIDIAVTKSYYIGFGCDNLGKIKLNGSFILEQNITNIKDMIIANGDPTGQNPIAVTFKYWYIYPVEIPAGENIIEVFGHNIDSVAAVGIQIYNATRQDLFDATNENPLGDKILFSSEELIGEALNYEYSITDGHHGYSCPDGYALNTCGETPVCVKRIEINCGEEPPTTTTTTTTG